MKFKKLFPTKRQWFLGFIGASIGMGLASTITWISNTTTVLWLWAILSAIFAGMIEYKLQTNGKKKRS